MAKKDAAVAAAEAACDAKREELRSAEAEVERLKIELGEAHRALREARLAADAKLPQAMLAKLHWRSGKIQDAGPVVVLRRTPTGQLVVRSAGEEGGEMRFKRGEFSGEWHEVVKRGRSFDAWVLRDVPAQFEPQREPQA